MGKKIGILGSGGWGISLGLLFFKKNFSVFLWEPIEENFKILVKNRESIYYFPGVKIPRSIKITNSIQEVIEESEILIITVRSCFFRETVKELKKYYKNQPVIVGTKGIEKETGMTMSQIWEKFLNKRNLFVLSGPTIAKEIVKGKPTCAVLAAENQETLKYLQNIINCENFRIYTSRDIIGVEIGGAFKNVLAIGAGIIDGLKLGINTKSAYLTRGLNEMVKIGTFLGGEEKTFRGLSGLGDLLTTSFSKYSRNRSFGEGIIKYGKENYLKKTKMVIEGIPATEVFYNISKKFNIELPITEAIYRIIYKNTDPKDEIKNLMGRPLKDE